MNEIRVCENEGEPMVFTVQFPGAEYICMTCGALEGIFGPRAASTPELALRLDELTEQFRRESAERRGIPYVPLPKVGEAEVPVPMCKSCGAVPVPGAALVNGKPPAWFSRIHDGEKEYACSRECIPEREAVLPW